MLRICFDINCIIDIEEKREGFEYVQQILETFQEGKIFAGVSIIHASEYQKNGTFLRNCTNYITRIHKVTSNLEILSSLPVLDFFWLDYSRLVPEPYPLLDKITGSIFGTNFHELNKKCATDRKLHNKVCDVLALETALYHNCFFITKNTRDFNNLPTDQKVQIYTPQKFVEKFLV